MKKVLAIILNPVYIRTDDKIHKSNIFRGFP